MIARLEEGLYVASGHSCWGICNGLFYFASCTFFRADLLDGGDLGPGTGLCMAELILDGKVTSADIGDLGP